MIGALIRVRFYLLAEVRFTSAIQDYYWADSYDEIQSASGRQWLELSTSTEYVCTSGPDSAIPA